MKRFVPGGLFGQFRVLVTGAPGQQRTFIWQIVRDTDSGRLTIESASTRTFRTMDEAHTAGTGVLKKMGLS